jgi:hypothetical protein
MHTGFWWESQKKRDHKEHLDAGQRRILNWILEKEDGVVVAQGYGQGNELSGSIKRCKILE